MNKLKQLIVAGLVAASALSALPAMAAESAEQQGFAHGPSYYAMQMEAYKADIARMTPEDRTKLVAMQDKLMQMEMDGATVKMKMDMEMAKMKRDIDMFVLTHSGRGQNIGG